MSEMKTAIAPVTGSTGGREQLGVRLLEALLFIALPLVFNIVMFSWAWQEGNLAFDFVHFELPAAEKVYHGESPYPGYGYPPLVAFALVPFVPIPGADILVTVLLFLTVPAILWLLEVRDWRCYGIAFLWAPVFHAIQTANVTLPMMLFLALAWRYRDAVVRSGVFVGLATAAKILAWPGGLWLLATRRARGWLTAIVTTVTVTFGLWGVLGLDGLNGYSTNLKGTGASNAAESYTITQLLVDLGAGRPVGRVVAIAVAAAILVACALAGWRGRDRVSFALAAAACVFASPINWLHSFAFVLLSVAVMRPRLSVAWFLPLPLMVCKGTGNGEPWQTAIALGITLLTVVWVTLTPPAAGTGGRDLAQGAVFPPGYERVARS